MPWKRMKPRPPLDDAGLYEYAVSALARRMRSSAELRRLMTTRVEPGESGRERIEGVLRRLAEQGYLNDHSFAADYTRLRLEGARFGRRRVAQDLQRKGVTEGIAVGALDAAYAQVDELALAQAYLERKRVRRPEDEKAAARVIRLLVRGGFSIGIAYRALRAWHVADEALPPEHEEDGPEEAPEDGPLGN